MLLKREGRENGRENWSEVEGMEYQCFSGELKVLKGPLSFHRQELQALSWVAEKEIVAEAWKEKGS